MFAAVRFFELKSIFAVPVVAIIGFNPKSFNKKQIYKCKFNKKFQVLVDENIKIKNSVLDDFSGKIIDGLIAYVSDSVEELKEYMKARRISFPTGKEIVAAPVNVSAQNLRQIENKKRKLETEKTNIKLTKQIYDARENLLRIESVKDVCSECVLFRDQINNMEKRISQVTALNIDWQIKYNSLESEFNDYKKLYNDNSEACVSNYQLKVNIEESSIKISNQTNEGNVKSPNLDYCPRQYSEDLKIHLLVNDPEKFSIHHNMVFIGSDSREPMHWYPEDMWSYVIKKSPEKLVLEIIPFFWTPDELVMRSVTARKSSDLSKKKFSPKKVSILEDCYVHKYMMDKSQPPREFDEKEKSTFIRSLKFTAQQEATKVVSAKLRQKANYYHQEFKKAKSVNKLME